MTALSRHGDEASTALGDQRGNAETGSRPQHDAVSIMARITASHPFRLLVVGLMVALVAVLTVVAMASVVGAHPDVAVLARLGSFGLVGLSVLLTIPALTSKLVSGRRTNR